MAENPNNGDSRAAESAAADGQRRLGMLLGRDERIPDNVLREEPEPDEQPGGGGEDAEDGRVARVGRDIDARLARLGADDDEIREALERRRSLLEESLESRERARVPRNLVHEAKEGFTPGSINGIDVPPYRYEIARELTLRGDGRLHQLEASDGFLQFDMDSMFDDGEVRCDAWAGVSIRPPSYGRLQVWSNPFVSYDYMADKTSAQPAIAYGSLWLLISRYTTGGRFIRPRPFQQRKVLFHEDNRSGSGAGTRSFFASIFIEPQYRYVIWLRLYGKVASNKGNMPLANLWASSAWASAEVHVPSIAYACY